MILNKIVEHKRLEIAERKKRIPLSRLYFTLREQGPTLDLARALTRAETSIIAEVKIASPSAGLLMKKHNPIDLAQVYQESGAAAVSVVTDQAFFQGNLALLTSVRKKVQLPILCKDFVIDEYQICEARVAGADAILLIAAILEENTLRRYLERTAELAMVALVEVHNEAELQKALAAEAELIGINNRDLKTFKVSLETTQQLATLVPKGKIVVSESGIKTRKDIQLLQKAGVRAFLIGETLITSNAPGKTLQKFLSTD